VRRRRPACSHGQAVGQAVGRPAAAAALSAVGPPRPAPPRTCFTMDSSPPFTHQCEPTISKGKAPLLAAAVARGARVGRLLVNGGARGSTDDFALEEEEPHCGTVLAEQRASLDLRRSYRVTDEGLRAVAAASPQLTSLILAGCSSVTDEGVQALAAACPHLTSLDLDGCISVTDRGLRALASGCPQLTALDLGSSSSVTDEGLAVLMEGCPQLAELRCSRGN
jgi:hypothetical protein